MSAIIQFFSAALYLVFVQNLVFSGGYGASEVIRTAARPKQLVLFAVMITYFSTITSLLCRLIWLVPFFKTANTTIAIVMFILVLVVVYLATALIIIKMLKGSGWRQEEKDKLLRQAGVAAFNTIVLAVPLINQRVAYTVSESIGAGIGAGFAFILATMIIHTGMKKIESNEEIPSCFKGTPAVFIYIAIISMAFTGISGKSLFF
ncbi:MAG: Rnf-Nqr domain containing protein [Oscillospiraceae bacterium]